jgi:hypothetical protein
MERQSKSGHLDPAAICRSSDPMAVRELLTTIGDKWIIFVALSLDLLGLRRSGGRRPERRRCAMMVVVMNPSERSRP